LQDLRTTAPSDGNPDVSTASTLSAAARTATRAGHAGIETITSMTRLVSDESTLARYDGRLVSLLDFYEPSQTALAAAAALRARPRHRLPGRERESTEILDRGI
jgi:hypothetical protein